MHDRTGIPFHPYETLLYQEFEGHPQEFEGHHIAYPESEWYPLDPEAFPPLTPGDGLDGAWDPPTGFIPPPRGAAEEAMQATGGFEVRRRRPRLAGRRRRPRTAVSRWPQVVASVFWGLTALTVAGVSLLSWVFSYQPLQDLAATHVPRGLAKLWPVLVYAPWLVACLSILRAALDRRRIAHSWAVVVLFSGTAAALCVTHAAQTVPGVVVAGLPPLTAVVSFHQLIRQITTTQRARHAPVSRPSSQQTQTPR
jgi:hypothetical protein